MTRRLLNHVGPVSHQGAIQKQAAGTARDWLADLATLAAGTMAATYLFDPIPTTGSLLASRLSQQVLPNTTNTSGHAYTATASATGKIRAAQRLWVKISEATIFRAVQLLLQVQTQSCRLHQEKVRAKMQYVFSKFKNAIKDEEVKVSL